ncbi:hypothetical protein COLO4_37983 [Corchorus olitorius]|uniref:Uncharacterized protein n=1 Tax=Corchorus olitorius TaxID=93759 RepID=A0A1R3FXM3_9ROSI|nr:hypothetical protein COLO4_37983 [Corchorus olitorius]
MLNMGGSKKSLGGYFCLAILVLTTMLLGSINFCAAEDAAKNISQEWNGRLLSNVDGVEMEFLLDSEASKMVLEASAATGGYSSKKSYASLKGSNSASCDRNTGKSCTTSRNSNTKVPPNCAPVSYNKDCHRY